MAKVFKIKHKKKDGTEFFSKNYYFKIKDGEVRKNFNTGTANKKEAEKIAAQYEEQNMIFPSPTPVGFISLAEFIKKNGWTDPKTNPKRKAALISNKNYGITQATKIASTFNHLLNKEEILDEWKEFIEENEMLDSSRFEHFTDFLFNKNAPELSKTNAREFVFFLDEYLKSYNKTALRSNKQYFVPNLRMCKIAFKAFYTFTVKEDILPNNVFANIPMSAPNKKTEIKDFFSKGDLRRMFYDEEALKTDEEFFHSPYYRFLKFLALSGMRSGEVRALRYKQFNKDNPNILTVNAAFKTNSRDRRDIGLPKWDKVRVIYLCDSALETVGEIGKDTDFVFTDKDGKPLRAEGIGKAFDKYLKKVDKRMREGGRSFLKDDKRFTPHTLRGSLNTMLINYAGRYEGRVVPLDSFWVQYYFGWTNTVLTEVQRRHYSAIDVFSLFLVANAIEREFSGSGMKFVPVDPDRGERKKIPNKGFKLE